MTTVSEIENAIKQLSPDELLAFRQWYSAFDFESWDDQIERDSKTGKLDFLLDEVRHDIREGRTKEI